MGRFQRLPIEADEAEESDHGLGDFESGDPASPASPNGDLGDPESGSPESGGPASVAESVVSRHEFDGNWEQTDDWEQTESERSDPALSPLHPELSDDEQAGAKAHERGNSPLPSGSPPPAKRMRTRSDTRNRSEGDSHSAGAAARSQVQSTAQNLGAHEQPPPPPSSPPDSSVPPAVPTHTSCPQCQGWMQQAVFYYQKHQALEVENQALRAENQALRAQNQALLAGQDGVPDKICDPNYSFGWREVCRFFNELMKLGGHVQLKARRNVLASTVNVSVLDKNRRERPIPEVVNDIVNVLKERMTVDQTMQWLFRSNPEHEKGGWCCHTALLGKNRVASLCKDEQCVTMSPWLLQDYFTAAAQFRQNYMPCKRNPTMQTRAHCYDWVMLNLNAHGKPCELAAVPAADIAARDGNP